MDKLRLSSTPVACSVFPTFLDPIQNYSVFVNVRVIMFVAKILLTVPVAKPSPDVCSKAVSQVHILSLVSFLLAYHFFSVFPDFLTNNLQSLSGNMVNQVIPFDYMAPQHLPRDYFNPKASSLVVRYSSAPHDILSTTACQLHGTQPCTGRCSTVLRPLLLYRSFPLAFFTTTVHPMVVP